MTIKRVQDTDGIKGVAIPIDYALCESPTGDHVLMTVEEYRERISLAWADGLTHPDCLSWIDSGTKRRLDADLGGEVEP
jgi:hypothetical protein